MPTIFSIVSSSANPAASAVPGQVAPIVLSAAGLVIVMILAMVAIVAIVIRKPKLLYLRRPYKLTGALILIWIATAWLGAHYYYSHVDDNFYQYELKSAAQQAENIAGNIDHSLHTLQGIPFVVAHARETLQALHNFGANQVHTAPSGRQRKLQWARDQRLTEINAYLNMMAVNLESDVVLPPAMQVRVSALSAPTMPTATIFIRLRPDTQAVSTQWDVNQEFPACIIPRLL